MRLRTIALAGVLTTAGSSAAFAQDPIIVTNGFAQIVDELCKDDGQLFYFPDALGWEIYGIGYWQPMWIDFSEYPSLQKLLTDATASTNQCVLWPPQYGVQPLHVTLTLDLLSGSLVLNPGCSSEELASESAPYRYQAGQWPADCRVVERLWEQWQTIQKDPDWQDWYGKDARLFLTFHFSVADLNEKNTYDDNLAAEDAAWEEWLKSGGDSMDSGSGGGMMLMMSSGDCDGCPVVETNAFQICGIDYDASNHVATITWPSCNTHFFDVYSTEELSFSTVWTFRTNLLGQVSSTMWTDYDDLSVLTARFYRVSGLSSFGDPDGDGLSNFQEALLATDPYNADTDGDGVTDGPLNALGIPDAFPLNPDYSADTDGDGVPDEEDDDIDGDGIPNALDPDPYVPITVAPFNTVIVETNNLVGDTGTEVFDVSSRGRPLPYAAGSSAANGFGRLYGGIYFNHDATNLYIGIAGLDIAPDNVFLLLLDTDGSSGGLTNFTGLSTSTQPWGVTRSQNLSFGATNFTPNVAILVGSKFGDGGNFASFDIGGRDFGQGVYGLSPTVISNFPGFGPAPGSRISQWGDLETLDSAKWHAANAGIEVAISKSALGLTNGAIFRAAAIIGGGANAQNTRWFSREAYGESVSGTAAFPNDFSTNAVALIGAPVYLSTNPPPAYSPVFVTDNDVMMQGFYWDVPKINETNGNWYVELASNAVDMAMAGFTAIWFPPPQKGENGQLSVGYDPFDHYDLGEYNQRFTVETRYGSRAELEAAINAFKSVGIAPYVDVVPNHMRGGASGPYYTNYVAGYFQKTPADFYVGISNLVSTPFHRQIDFGDELNQTVPQVRKALNAWGEWLTSIIGFEGFRVDHSNGIEPWFQSEFLRQPAHSNKFAVLEYNIDASVREMQTWVQLVDQRASLFDFRLHDKLVQMCGPANNGFSISQMYKAGLAGIAPGFAVTFVENHDSIRPCFQFDPQVGIQQDKILAYAYILISEGHPSVFYHDYYNLPNAIVVTNFGAQCFGGADDGFVGTPLKPQIDKLIEARINFAAGATSLLSHSNSNHVYVVRRAGGGEFSKPGCILAINRAATNISVTVGSGYTSTNLVDRVDTNIPPFSVTTTSSGTATFSVPGRGYRVLGP